MDYFRQMMDIPANNMENFRKIYETDVQNSRDNFPLSSLSSTEVPPLLTILVITGTPTKGLTLLFSDILPIDI